MQLDKNNEWIRMGDLIPWQKLEHLYSVYFPSKSGRPAHPFREALGTLIIQRGAITMHLACRDHLTSRHYINIQTKSDQPAIVQQYLRQNNCLNSPLLCNLDYTCRTYIFFCIIRKIWDAEHHLSVFRSRYDSMVDKICPCFAQFILSYT